MNDWSFWIAQLAGFNPETTPGEPHAGFYTSGSSGEAYKRARPVDYIAIWKDEDGEWIAKTNQSTGGVKINRGWQVDEYVFPRCCRNAIDHETYLARVKELEEGSNGQCLTD